jgi:hypothetical protein
MPPVRDDPNDPTIYCGYELARSPREEFYSDSEHGTVHFQNVQELHTISGDAIKVVQIPGVAFRIEEELKHDIVQKIPGVGAILKERFDVENVDELREKL